MTQTFYSNGKLLLTGEYVVLDGATALALPTKFGQDLTVNNGKNKEISWKSFDSDGSIWFEDVLTFKEIVAEKDLNSPASVRSTLIEILHEAYVLNPEFINASEGYEIETRLTFPKFWGLGTSSTLINNIAQWLGIDAFQLLRNSFGGSGYDIACAQHNTPILYRLDNGLQQVEKANFNPAFSENIYFVYLNRKQSSKAAIESYYLNRTEDLQHRIAMLDRITQTILNAEHANVFAHALQQHENIISDIVEMKTAKESFFPDFDGVVKSLGGWGGDFVLAVAKDNPTDYFAARGFLTVIPYRDIILSQ